MASSPSIPTQRGPIERGNENLQRAYNLGGSVDAQKFYDEWADLYDSDIGALGYASPRRSVEAIVKYFEPPNASQSFNILDAGCGTGMVGACLGQSSLATKFILDGVDLSEGMLAAARTKNIYRDLEVANLDSKIEKPSASYDVVVCVGTLTEGHVGPHAITEFARLTAKSGLIVATVLSKIWESGGYKAEVERLRESGTVQIASTDEFGILDDATSGARMVVLRKQ